LNRFEVTNAALALNCSIKRRTLIE
jgi:hypothetical protein